MNIRELGDPHLPPWWIVLIVSLTGTVLVIVLVSIGHYLWKHRKGGAVTRIKLLEPKAAEMTIKLKESSVRAREEELAEQIRSQKSREEDDAVMEAVAKTHM